MATEQHKEALYLEETLLKQKRALRFGMGRGKAEQRLRFQ